MSEEHRQTEDSVTGSRELVCPRCETGHLIYRQCTLICEGCGYVESCEDNFVPIQANPQ